MKNVKFLAFGFLVATSQTGDFKDSSESSTVFGTPGLRAADYFFSEKENGLSGMVSRVQATAGQEERPNVILITADDLGQQLGCYGDKYARTPALDKLASEGVRFSTTWVSQSSSSASRSSIFTGLYPHQNGQVGLAHLGFYCRETPRLPNLLKAAGYRTGILGKLHVGPEENFQFDHEVKQNWTIDVKRVTREAMAFITSDEEKPFFLKISYFDPHGPLKDQVEGIPEKIYKQGEVPVMSWVRGNKESAQKQVASFYNATTRVDVGISLLMDELRRSGKIKNTLIIFVGDNGAAFTGGKTTCYDPGMEVPLIIYWEGGKIKTGQVRNDLVSTLDIMPTILEACGVKAPDNLEGSSLIPLLKGAAKPKWRNYMFGEMNFHEPHQYMPMRTVRNSRFHLINNLYEYKSPEWELYDLSADPDEVKNIANDPAYGKELAQLKGELAGWRKKTNDPLLDPETDKKWKELAQQAKGTNRFDPPIFLVK